MMHFDRHWCVSAIDTVEELAEKLSRYSWCCCTGFECQGLLWLNDATGPDGAQEYAVVRIPTADDPHFRQIESITVSWCTPQQLQQYITEVQSGGVSVPAQDRSVVIARSSAEFADALGAALNPQGRIVSPTIEAPEQHGGCPHCA